MTKLLSLLLLFFISNNVSAASFSMDFGEGPEITSRIMQMFVIITILSLAPSILIMITSFTRIIVVFSFLRSALGLQQSPPNSVLISLALFLTFFIMSPTFEKAYDEGIMPLLDEKISEREALTRTSEPFRKFMLQNLRQQDLELFINISGSKDLKDNIQNAPFTIVTPAFIISELRRAFEIGFLIFLPFLIIDLIVSSILMAMGMMMLPPVMVSMPFKIIFFVLIDGWYMICGSLVKSYYGL